MKNSWSSYVRNTAFRPAGLSRGSSSSEAFWNAPFSLSNSSIFSPVNCWNTRGFVLASSYFIFFPPLPSFYSLLHAFPIDSRVAVTMVGRERYYQPIRKGKPYGTVARLNVAKDLNVAGLAG